jgi:transposase
MQGKKHYEEKFFVNFRLSERIPEGNFYKRLKESIDFEYLRELTKCYYGSEGHKSIDPVVFFKLMLVGYLENICSDRKIIEQSSLRLDVLYFLGYDIDEPLPWHSTLSRTRRLLGEEVFLGFFRDILRKCVAEGIVDGKTQAVDSAFIKANASMGSLAEKELSDRSKNYFDEITVNEESSEETGATQPRKNKKPPSNYNERYSSRTDPDARASQKKGKPLALNHLGIISVDARSHVICGATVDYADRKDCETTEKIMSQTIENLSENGIAVENMLADTGYSSGDTYKYLEEKNITAYIPANARYKAAREGFSYDKKKDCYVCRMGAELSFKGIKSHHSGNTQGRVYRATTEDCRGCPLKAQCCKKQKFRQIEDTVDKPYYDAASERMGTDKGKWMRRLRSATVEPVLGTLLCFKRMRKMYTNGNKSACKQLLMAAAAYNLKKLMYAIGFKGVNAAANAAKAFILDKILIWNRFASPNSKIFAMQ